MSLLDVPSPKTLTLKLPSPASIRLEEELTLSPADPYQLAREVDCSADKPVQWMLKRCLDYSLGLLALLLFLPVLAVIAVAIKLDSPGPILFKQKRIGLHGRQFEMFKFRSMYTDAEVRLEKLLALNESGSGMFKMANDPRVTRLGNILRKYSLDELPQIFNVLRGEMSLCGPRPPLLRELAFYEPWHYVRFGSMPGMTGLWQVSGRSNITDFDHVVQLDYQYISEWRFLLDIKLILKTIPAVLFSKGAH
jgi:lipopolysaccharide/colanic/teichoic acid biosynthesis glycosyltransferase